MLDILCTKRKYIQNFFFRREKFKFLIINQALNLEIWILKLVIV
jgi:hypothetical protein